VTGGGPTIADALLRSEARCGDARGYVGPEGERSYGELASGARRAAQTLIERGVRPGDRVVLAAENGLDFLEWTFAVAWCGAVLVPLNWRLAPREVAGLFALCEPCAVVRQSVFDELIDAALDAGSGSVAVLDAADRASVEAGPPHPSCENDLAHLYCTSGTTGEPKGVELTHRNVCQHALYAICELELTDRDVWGHVAPMFHLADAWATVAITFAGGVHTALPRFEPRATLELFERSRVTVTNLVPTMLALMVADESIGARDLSAFRLVLSGGASIAPETVRRVEAAFRCEYVQTYGMTETSPYLTLSRLGPTERALPEDERFRYRARTGRPFLGIELEVVDANGNQVPRDDATVGEIRVRGATVTRGYWRRPDLTEQVLRDGWLYTGDLARIEPRGFVEIVDRAKDMVVTGGENVYTTEVENALFEHHAVIEAAVYGEPDPIWGEIVCAAVVLRDGEGSDAEALGRHCRARLAAYKCPRRFRILDGLPRTGSGKIAKRLLREGSDGGTRAS
jgi:fatty-acyl-CoA synthase